MIICSITAGNNNIRLLPPLNINVDEVEYFITSIKKIIK